MDLFRSCGYPSSVYPRLAVLLLPASISACGGSDPALSARADGGPPTGAAGWQSAAGDERLDCGDPTGGAVLRVGGRSLHIGYEQASANNQNPVVALREGATTLWCKRHETEGPDGRAVGVTWDGGPRAYLTYQVAGGGSALDRAADGWLKSYAPGAFSGGGATVSVVGALDVQSGDLAHATFVIAVLSSGRVNTLRPDGAVTVLPDGAVAFRGISAYAPLNPDRQRMDCSGPSGFSYRVELSADLSQAHCASVEAATSAGQTEASRCAATTPCTDSMR